MSESRNDAPDMFASGEYLLSIASYRIKIQLREERVPVDQLETLKEEIIQRAGAAILSQSLTPAPPEATVDAIQKAVAANFVPQLTQVKALHVAGDKPPVFEEEDF